MSQQPRHEFLSVLFSQAGRLQQYGSPTTRLLILVPFRYAFPAGCLVHRTHQILPGLTMVLMEAREDGYLVSTRRWPAPRCGLTLPAV